MNSSEWFAGKEAIPPKISLGSLYDGEGLKEVTGVQDKPSSSVATETKAEPEAKPASPVKKAPEPTPEAKPAPSMKEQGASMAAMVNKFADDEEPEVVEESSFDDPSKPVERPARSETSSPSVKASPFLQKEEQAKTQTPPAVE
ncbi:hypothetical protein COL922a_014625, partial [Colletotrichum nupharicola]